MVMLFPSFYPSVKKKPDKKSPDPYSSIKFLAEIRIPTSFSTIPVQDHPQLEWMASSITDPNFPQQLTFLSRITPSWNEWHQRSQQCLHMCINTQPLLTVLCVLIYIHVLYPCYQVQVLLVNALIINHRSNYWIHIVVVSSTPYLHEKATYKWKKISYHLIQLENHPNKFFNNNSFPNVMKYQNMCLSVIHVHVTVLR